MRMLNQLIPSESEYAKSCSSQIDSFGYLIMFNIGRELNEKRQGRNFIVNSYLVVMISWHKLINPFPGRAILPGLKVAPCPCEPCVHNLD
jgi:hypothetical protein